ncbi:MAG: rhomboid family intramembrane serine protease [Planctomycetes bacterium]|nr:rhomboid family intramembrane serine protease [Planctomycetota bacterium]
MGLHDRYYYHDNAPLDLRPSFDQRSAVVVLIIINVVIFLANALLGVNKENSQGVVNDLLVLRGSEISQPWWWWHALSYSFAHNRENINHILFNMLSLYFMGRPVEQRYGTREFYRIYLICALFCGALWLIKHAILGGGSESIVLGASGAVLCISMLFILNYPTVTVFLLFIPMPAWVMGVILVLLNFFTLTGEGIAYDVHLAGIGFAFMYFFLRWNFSWLESPAELLGTIRRKVTGPRLKVIRDREFEREQLDAREADRILAKIHESGKDALTSKEKRFMERYSQAMRNKKKAES